MELICQLKCGADRARLCLFINTELLKILTHRHALFEWIAHIIIWAAADGIVVVNLTPCSS